MYGPGGYETYERRPLYREYPRRARSRYYDDDDYDQDQGYYDDGDSGPGNAAAPLPPHAAGGARDPAGVDWTAGTPHGAAAGREAAGAPLSPGGAGEVSVPGPRRSGGRGQPSLQMSGALRLHLHTQVQSRWWQGTDAR